MTARLIHGDCLDVMRGMESESVEAVIADPPGGLDYQSARRTDKTARLERVSNDARPFIWCSQRLSPSEMVHPTQKPVDLMRQIVGCVSRPGDTILDPFSGSGSTLLAARNLGRRAIGVEIEEKYCQVTVKRLAQEVLTLEAGEEKA